VYDVSVEGGYPFEIQGYKAMPVVEGEVFSIPIRVAVDRRKLDVKKTDIRFRIRARENPEITAAHSSTFIGP
jgi:hypothetical protein